MPNVRQAGLSYKLRITKTHRIQKVSDALPPQYFWQKNRGKLKKTRVYSLEIAVFKSSTETETGVNFILASAATVVS
ncbi:MAG: hypothetical protein HC817_10320 [Saprospiraceae bacterium]|nr:hypothetical protein [Saprospiraceae bacterium]